MANALFVCLHNAGRSQMSQALFERAAEGRHGARSAGTTPGEHVHPEVVEVMLEVGIDLADRVPHELTEDDARWADVVVTMGCGDECPYVPGKRYVDWDLPDPRGRPLDEVRRQYETNVFGLIRMCQLVLPGMREHRQGSIIAISSSVGGEMAAPDFAPYQAAKSGLTALIKHTGGTFAAEGVRANAIHPGPIRTPALEENGFTAGAEAAAAGFPIPRVSEPDEIAWAAVYLGSDESTYMTASKMVIDGGSSSFLGAVDQSGSR